MAKIYTMVGLPGSGKSTHANKLNCKIISTDAIRKELFGNEEIQENGAKVFNLAYERMAKEIAKGNNVVFDATNLTRRARKRILKLKAEHIAMVVNTSVEECKERNSKRERVVPTEVIERMANKFTIPTVEEGFDKVIIL